MKTEGAGTTLQEEEYFEPRPLDDGPGVAHSMARRQSHPILFFLILTADVKTVPPWRQPDRKIYVIYAFGAGQSTLGPGSSQLPYAPLPADLKSKDNAQLATMTCNGSAIK